MLAIAKRLRRFVDWALYGAARTYRVRSVERDNYARLQEDILRVSGIEAEGVIPLHELERMCQDRDQQERGR